MPPYRTIPSNEEPQSARFTDNGFTVNQHHVTLAKIGEDQLFYFAQRGISEEDAVSMLVSGFCKDVLSKEI